MSAMKADLVSIKRELVVARSCIQATQMRAWRAGEFELAKRLRSIADYLGKELDLISAMLATLP